MELQTTGQGEGPALGDGTPQPGVLAYVSRFAGASAGSLVALQLALGYTPDDIDEMARTTNMDKEMRDGPCSWCCGPCHCFSVCCGVAQLLSCCGFHLNALCCRKKPLGLNPGKRLEAWIGDCIEKKTGRADTTFNDLYEMTGTWNAETGKFEGVRVLH